MLEVADVLRAHWSVIEHSPSINAWQLRTLGAIMRCRTAEMGGHVDSCTTCGTVVVSYNSCRNRHCPKCQGHKREQWIAARNSELLPVPYLHVVFTLPSELNTLALHQPKAVYDSLFAAAWGCLQTFGKDGKHLGAATGMICILHTWGQNLSLHPHLHCIVPAGGLSKTGCWKPSRGKGKFLFPVKAMSIVFKAQYLALIRGKVSVDQKLLNELYKKSWVVYAKRPFAHPKHVVEYLGRYSHKIAISNSRLEAHDGDQVTFRYKDYRKGGEKAMMVLDAREFIRRFAMHILPKGFVRIRHYGILSSTTKRASISQIRAALGTPLYVQLGEGRKLKQHPLGLCPCCKTPTMITIELLPKRGPPSVWRLQKRERLTEV